MRASAVGDVLRRLREHRLDRPKRRQPEARREPSAPSRIAASATRRQVAGEHRRPAHVGRRNARRPATASAITPSSAPCRSSPRNRPTSNRCSGSVARAKSARELRATRRLRARAGDRLKSRDRGIHLEQLERRGSARAPAGRASAAQPTPTVPCGSSPERYATATATSSGAAPSRHSASRATFASRDDVAATSAEVSAIRNSSSGYLPFV